MYCRNCGHADSFVLLVDLAARVDLRRESAGPTDWSLAAACPSCASTDVAGDPAALLGRLTD